ncbi:eukaryotic translation initiation factor 3 subunit A [Malassezia brasiliensis]|uniref:Eukaryotic translation initiation factor 3 subunit A n=1 Tax=Malassezia brasiliensis TaxID=1821822 RepID=A0AAF0DW12_9BASI|nr:eukaryotic translation initiation factor 3 subunit A [Malassezia brasiliensis]
MTGADPRSRAKHAQPQNIPQQDIEMASDVRVEEEGLGANAWAEETDGEIHLSTPFLPSSLAWQSVPSHNDVHAPPPLSPHARRQLFVRTLAYLAVLLGGAILALIVTVRLALPVIADEDRAAIRIPRNFEQLKALNDALQHYSHTHFFRVMIAWSAIYLFLQTFSVPGSMYMNILAGAMWGMPIAVPWRVQSWRAVVQQYDENMTWYMTLLRMMPVPPDFMLNIVAPHLGIDIGQFWVSCFLGVISMVLVHTAIGEELGDMTSSDDFHMFSFKNVLIMLVCGIAMVVPILVKRYVQSPEDDGEAQGAIRLATDPSPWRQRIRAWLQPLLARIHPHWRQQDAGFAEAAEYSDEELSESVSAWRNMPSAEAGSQRALETMPTLANTHAFDDRET